MSIISGGVTAYRRLERFMLIISFMNHKENVTVCHLREKMVDKTFQDHL